MKHQQQNATVSWCYPGGSTNNFRRTWEAWSVPKCKYLDFICLARPNYYNEGKSTQEFPDAELLFGNYSS